MSLSQWCSLSEPIEMESITTALPGEPKAEWETVQVDQHQWCALQRWHDEYHGKDPGCCASPDERESWACNCDCHDGLAGA